MRWQVILIMFAFLVLFEPEHSVAQRIVFDLGHFNSVNENAIIRNSAELSHSQFQQKISQSLDKINLNSASIAAAQTMIHYSLSNVNSALSQGIMIRNMGNICSEILSYGRQMATLAKAEPYLLLFAENMIRDFQQRSVKLTLEVSEFILKEDSGILMDYNSRDELLKKINTNLHILCGLSYGAWKAMYYAKINTIFKTLNPFAAYLNQDINLVSQIISNAKYLKP